jgi:hypothetical protein
MGFRRRHKNGNDGNCDERENENRDQEFDEGETGIRIWYLVFGPPATLCQPAADAALPEMQLLQAGLLVGVAMRAGIWYIFFHQFVRLL